MRSRVSRSIGATVALVAAASMTACAVDGSPVRAPAALDVGVYGALRESALPDATTDAAWARLRAVRLADHIVFPIDVDPELTRVKFPTMPIVAETNLTFVIDGADSVPELMAMRHGYTVAADDQASDIGLNHTVLAFAGDRAADAAATALAALESRKDQGRQGEGRLRVDGMPDSSVVDHVRVGGSNRVTGITVAGAYIVVTRARAPEQEHAERIVARAYTEQAKLISGVGPEDTDRNPDPTGLIRGTVAILDKDRMIYDRVVRGRRAEALHHSNGPRALAAMTTAGITSSATNRTRAHLAASPRQAQGFRDYVTAAFDSGGAKRADSPRDLSTASCFVSGGTRFSCVVAVGRYVGEASGGTLLSAQQQISAAYTFLSQM
ncbi:MULTISPECIES: DUF7373 family lipoprotein [Gordonia]|jgi:hypothetical protein|uniref:DUF7373 family lipoprotein n=1 Tax=Gordonia TaxID=2053 RepID=UPI0030FE762D